MAVASWQAIDRRARPIQRNFGGSMTYPRRLFSAFVLLLFVAADPSLAQTATDAARSLDPSLQRERILRDLEYFEERDAPSEVPSGEPVILGPAPGGDGSLPETQNVFELEAIRFNDSAFIDSDTLNDIASKYISRPVRFADLNEMIGEINAIYAQRGIVSARALIPAQTIDNGVLVVRLVEGRLGQLEIEGNAATRDGFIASRLPLSRGEVVDVPALRESLTWLNRTTELRIQSALRAGQNPGETDMLIQVDEPPRVSAQVFIDNLGTESTGEIRGGAIVQIYSPLGIDDRLVLYTVGSEGTKNHFLSYRFPFNRSGGRVDVSYSQGDIEIIDGPFVPLDITGDSSSYDVTFTQPFLRGDTFWLEAYAGGSWSESSTSISGAALSEFDVTRYTLGFQLRGFTDRSVWSLRQGGSRANSENIFGDTLDLNLFNGNGSYFYRINDSWSAQARGGWQYTSEETVPSPLLFQIGGISSVRGYPEGALAGARGYYVNLEAQHQWRDGLAPFAFIDHGLVDDISPDRETISSMGIGLAWQYGQHLSGELSWGHALEKVLPDQDSGRLHARVAYSWAGF